MNFLFGKCSFHFDLRGSESELQAGHTMGSQHRFHLVCQLFAVKITTKKKNEVWQSISIV
jgi:hypothetical protein